MAFMNWSPSLSVNVNEIDEQHKHLVKLINDLHDAMKDGKGNEIISKVLMELINYTKTHFSTEEKYMQKFNYPEYNQHKNMHNEFIKKVNEVQQAYKSGQNITLEIMKFLNTWVTNHIMGADKKYSACFNQNGLK